MNIHKNIHRLLQLKYYVIIIVTFTILFSIFGWEHTDWYGMTHQDDNGFVKKIFNRLYYTIICFSTIGLGDIVPNTFITKFLTMLIGVFTTMGLITMFSGAIHKI